MGRPVFRAVDSQTGAAVFNVPTGTINGDLLLWWVACASSGTYTFPAGWTVIHTGTSGGSPNVNVGLAWRVAASEPATYTVTQSLGATVDGVMIGYFSAKPSFEGPSAASSAGTPATAAAPSVTTTFPNEMLVTFIGTGVTITGHPPGGMTERANNLSTNIAFNVSELAWDTPGATGVKSVAISNGTTYGIALLIRSADSDLIVTD